MIPLAWLYPLIVWRCWLELFGISDELKPPQSSAAAAVLGEEKINCRCVLRIVKG